LELMTKTLVKTLSVFQRCDLRKTNRKTVTLKEANR
jgi:hypothetical protein